MKLQIQVFSNGYWHGIERLDAADGGLDAVMAKAVAEAMRIRSDKIAAGETEEFECRVRIVGVLGEQYWPRPAV